MACLQELLKGGAPAMDSARRHARSAVRAACGPPGLYSICAIEWLSTSILILLIVDIRGLQASAHYLIISPNSHAACRPGLRAG